MGHVALAPIGGMCHVALAPIARMWHAAPAPIARMCHAALAPIGRMGHAAPAPIGRMGHAALALIARICHAALAPIGRMGHAALAPIGGMCHVALAPIARMCHAALAPIGWMGHAAPAPIGRMGHAALAPIARMCHGAPALVCRDRRPPPPAPASMPPMGDIRVAQVVTRRRRATWRRLRRGAARGASRSTPSAAARCGSLGAGRGGPGSLRQRTANVTPPSRCFRVMALRVPHNRVAPLRFSLPPLVRHVRRPPPPPRPPAPERAATETNAGPAHLCERRLTMPREPEYDKWYVFRRAIVHALGGTMLEEYEDQFDDMRRTITDADRLIYVKQLWIDRLTAR